MKLAFSLATGIVWSLIALLELTSLFPEPFTFSPIRTAVFASLGVAGIVMATMHYAWQMWFARVCAVVCLSFLVLAYWLNLLPNDAMRLPMMIALVFWTMFAALTGYEKAPSLPGRTEYRS